MSASVRTHYPASEDVGSHQCCIAGDGEDNDRRHRDARGMTRSLPLNHPG
jgi:hypothetical protein